MTSQEQIDSFYRFASEQLAKNGSQKSVDDLYDQWRLQNLSPEESLENIAAVRAAFDDMKNGDDGRDAGEVERELREELRMPAPE